MTRTFRTLALFLFGFALAACSADIGPDETLLYGTWLQEGPTQAGETLLVEKAVITYAPDGTSDFTAIMTLTENNGIPERFTINADVLWTLQETILIRTLNDVTVRPDISTPQGDALAAALADEYRASPPGRLIIEQIDDTTLVLLDADSGTNLTYRKQLTPP
ncbi:hypothetical protein GCM10009069_11170 [Algimonas arctica]|uniref:DUF306 domain-containing protein n=1 Tax=Algimonas arctica TaxID=1479486 RepID=A0A8J3CR69_9PROT|nr:hypothetical protein [Algimonas arctica]GHA89783.1 hypothetical protein GCM10009069_11170 [Algimonas arctica]